MALLCVACLIGKALLCLLALVAICRLYLSFFIGVCTSRKRLDGKVVIVTGGNSGIGKEAAKDLAMRGAKVILACRNIPKAEKAALEISKACPGSQVTVKKLDLCSIQSIRHFAEEILKEETRLDVLANNAGLAGDGKLRLTEDGFEEVYQCNYLGPVYLTELLLPLLKKSAPSRVVNTGSAAHLIGRVNPATFPDQIKTLDLILRYGDTKLAMLMWTRAIADELRDSGVTVNVLHPGVVNTSFLSKGHEGVWFNMGKMFLWIFGRNCVQGAQTIIHLSVAEEVQGTSGQYWDECARVKFLVRPTSKEANRHLLTTSRKVLGLH